tara:strand:- start:1044 stop:2135 length:1092 start_codon:yes stop_codon:yes gene_type:complete
MVYKIKYKFWSRQPVFHLHNLWYWLFPPGIIEHGRPKKDKFYDPKLYFNDYFSTPTKKKALFAHFIKAHYLPHKNELYSPPKNGVLNYFKSHNSKCYLTMIYDKYNPKKLIGTMSCRPLNCFIKNNKMIINYVDFLCVHQKYRKKGIAPKIIYSHSVDVRTISKNKVFLFKREGSNTLIVPLTIYNNYLFDIHYWDKLVKFDQSNIRTTLITKQTFHLFYEVFEKIKKSSFECLVLPELSHLKLLIENQQIFVCVTLIDNEPYDCFFFRNTYTNYAGKNSIEAFASFQETDESVFVLSFLSAISLIYKIHKFERLFIENISNNNIIIKNILKRYAPIMKGLCSYYFYNFAYRPFLSNSILLLN